MKIDIHCLTDGSRGVLEQGEFGDAVERACAYSALTGQTDLGNCPAVGWPTWLAELLIEIFDNAPPELALERAIGFAEAAKVADARGADWDEVFRAFRLDSVLPIALESIGEGNEPWRKKCREVVQEALKDGRAVPEARHAAGATWAAGAARAAWAAGAARADAHTRIYESICKVMRGKE